MKRGCFKSLKPSIMKRGTRGLWVMNPGYEQTKGLKEKLILTHEEIKRDHFPMMEPLPAASQSGTC